MKDELLDRIHEIVERADLPAAIAAFERREADRRMARAALAGLDPDGRLEEEANE